MDGDVAAEDRFGLRVELIEDAAVVHVRGELDVASTPDLTEAVEPLVGAVAEIVFDVAELRFIDSSGLAAVARLLQAQPPPRVVIRRPSAMVRRVLEISQLSSLVTVES
jgi:anti-anti-sigma factor